MIWNKFTKKTAIILGGNIQAGIRVKYTTDGTEDCVEIWMLSATDGLNEVTKEIDLANYTGEK